MDPTGWLGVMLDGLIGAAVGGAVAALVAWRVVESTKRHDRELARERALRDAIVAWQHAAGRYSSGLTEDNGWTVVSSAVAELALVQTTLSPTTTGAPLNS